MKRCSLVQIVFKLTCVSKKKTIYYFKNHSFSIIHFETSNKYIMNMLVRRKRKLILEKTKETVYVT